MSNSLDNLGYITDLGTKLLPDKVALIQGESSLTYEQLDERANQVANALLNSGVSDGERVLMLFSNDIRFVECLLGIIRAGAVAVPVNPRLSRNQHEQLLADSGAEFLIATSGHEATAEDFLRRGLCRISVAVEAKPGVVEDYEAWIGAATSARPPGECQPDDVCLQAYTSGSTGVPKGVLLTHRGLLQNARLTGQALGVDVDERVLVATPLFHLNAAAIGLLPCLSSGASVVILPEFKPHQVVEAIAHYRCTYTTGVPAMYKLVLGEAMELSALDLSALRFIVCGSAPMPEPLLAELGQRLPGVEVLEAYGITESGPCVAFTPRWHFKKRGSVGLPLRGFEVRIVDGRGEDLEPGEIGELWIRSACISAGYFRRDAETATRYRPDGWFKTGDLFRRDAEGWLFFMGRGDDMFSVGGENVYPAEVEAVIAQHPDVRDVAVVPRSHDVKGEVPVAFVVRTKGSTLTAAALQEFCLQRAAAYAHPRDVIFLDVMPLAGSGKPDRHELARLAQDGLPAVSAPGAVSIS